MTSYLAYLECTICGATYPADLLSGVSPCCSKVLYARYDLHRIQARVKKSMDVELTMQSPG